MKLVLSLLIFTTVSFTQSYELVNKFGDFKNASSFYIDPAGYIYVTDINTDEVSAMDTSGTVLKKIGGYGWSASSFDKPVDIFADALKVFVADKNNHRIQRFDKNLNFNFQIYTRDSDVEAERFGYPLSAVMSNQGDVFILDSENSRIVKFDIFGNFIQNFGGYDYGNFALQKPRQLAVSSKNDIYVIDGKQIIIFDQYGNGIGRVDGHEEFTSIRIIFNWLSVTTKGNIYVGNLNSPELNLKQVILNEIEGNTELVSCFVFNNRLYLLSRKKIFVYDKI